ncbi:DUF6615 family protein [Mesorhizobium sp. L48C026A00]|uniref:DUF6615 family protein n=1 Tax=Mesorhizobium sp. L48C026A00 TaxID=1287182 RepID=UPI0003D051CE|nr:DUF6615 family protein [Mesorhizobium sp. L48C026A00]ESZ13715.1 hypothetical protein X737_25915 [Mesorhizobium sp. L48C026A00]
MPTTMCDLAKTLPLLIGRLLDREAKLKRGRFREETMTDIFTGALAAFAGPELVIQYPIEAVTGGDLDLRFWHIATGRELQLRIQAKRLSAAFNSKKAVNIAHRSYHELLHKPPRSAKFQFETLVDAPPPWVPLYMFYNHQSAADDPYFAGVGPTVSGVNLAFAADVVKELKLKLNAAKAKRKSVKHHKRLSHLREHLFGLEAILCPGGDWEGAGVPPPDVVSASLRERWAARGEGTARPKDEDIILRIPSEPLEMLPDGRFGRRIPDGPPIRVDRTVERPVVTFISGRTGDDRTPIITEESERWSR